MSALAATFERLLNGQDLSYADCRGVMTEVMSGDFSEILFGAWLTALRIKGETADEIAGCASVMAEKASIVRCPDHVEAIDIVGTGGDCAHTINISTAAAILAAAAGATVAKHGNRAVSSKSGAADVLAALGVNLEAGVEQMERCLREIGVAFLFAPMLHPAMKYAVPTRKALKVRTIFNILGPLCNPAQARRAVIGVYAAPLCRLMAEASFKMGSRRVMIVHGEDGLDEITTAGDTQICELQNGEIREYVLDPRRYGVARVAPPDLRGGEPAFNADVIRRTFSGEKGPARDVIALNAAAALIVAELAADWPEALEKAFRTIDNGFAAKKLNLLIALTAKP